MVGLKIFTQNNETFTLELLCTPVLTSFVFQHQVRFVVKKNQYLRNLKIAVMLLLYKFSAKIFY